MTEDVDELLAKAQLKELEQSEPAQFFKARKEPQNSLTDWAYLKSEVSSILRGDWNLDDFRTPEMGAAWMYLYIFRELQANKNRNVTLNADYKTGFEVWLTLGDHVFTLDFKPMLLELFESEGEDSEDFKNIMDRFRNMLDLIEHERAMAERTGQ